MSVAARTRPRSARSAPTVLIFDMSAMTFFSSLREANPRLIAVVAMPVPSGFVKTSKSPERAFAFVVTRRTSTIPVTARPYIGSGLRMEWPPMITHPTSAALARPPRKMEETTFGGTRSAGKPTTLSAVNGRAPIAKMSESELAAAICP